MTSMQGAHNVLLSYNLTNAVHSRANEVNLTRLRESNQQCLSALHASPQTPTTDLTSMWSPKSNPPPPKHFFMVMLCLRTTQAKCFNTQLKLVKQICNTGENTISENLINQTMSFRFHNVTCLSAHFNIVTRPFGCLFGRIKIRLN